MQTSTRVGYAGCHLKVDNMLETSSTQADSFALSEGGSLESPRWADSPDLAARDMAAELLHNPRGSRCVSCRQKSQANLQLRASEVF